MSQACPGSPGDERRGAVATLPVLPRAVAVTVAAVAVTVASLGTSGVRRRIAEPCGEDICTPFERPNRVTLELLSSLHLSVPGYALAFTMVSWALLLLAIGVGMVLVWRRPSLLAVVTAVQLCGLFLTPFLDALAVRGGLAELLGTVVVAGIQGTLPLLFGLFPDGRWHPRWFAKAWPIVGIIEVISVVASRSGWIDPDSTVIALHDVLSGLLLIGIQLHRYLRASDWTARQQAKWFVVGFFLLALNVLVAVVLSAAGQLARWQLGVVLTAYLGFLVLVLGLAFALLRYRLYDVNVVLRRTALYAVGLVLLLTAYLALVALASLSMARASASIAGAAVVAALALGGGLVMTRAGGWIRDRLLGARGRPGGVAEALARDMSGSPDGPANLAGTIAVALGLPYAAVLDGDGHALWTHGEQVGPQHRETVVDGAGRELGTLLLGPANGERLDRRDRRALREVLPFVVLVLRAQAEAEELRSARAIAATAREDERRRLRRDLHDGVGPLLAGQLLTLDSLRLTDGSEAGPVDLLKHLELQARSAISEVRRISRDLRPAALDTGDGLEQALAAETERFRIAGLAVELRSELNGAPLPAAVEVAVLRLVQEALTNVTRHAGARLATVVAVLDGRMLEVEVTDDGNGGGVGATPGVGTASMRERTRELGGTLDIGPGPDGIGTCVRGRIPW
jgi:two-component system NarL family sensor kinase